MRVAFIAGAHTDVGKTHVACALLRAARAQGLKVEALKPVASGFDPADWTHSDPGRLLAAMGRPLTPPELDHVSPWRFAAPAAPPAAAAAEGRALPFSPIAEFCTARLAESRADLLLVEGVGGVMSPLAEKATCLDLIEALRLPVLLVGGGYLGAISHALTALETLRARRIGVAEIIVSQAADPDAPDFAQSVALTADHAQGVTVVAAPRGGEAAWALEVLARLA